MRRSNENAKKAAKALFIETRMTQLEIAEMLELSEHTISAWAQKGEWRKQLLIEELDDFIVSDLREQIVELLKSRKKKPAGEQLIDSSQADLLSKLSKTYSQFERDVTIRVSIRAMFQFTEWLRKTSPEGCLAMEPYFNGYVKHLSKNGKAS